MGKSRSRNSYDDEDWVEKEEKFNVRRQKRHVRDVNTVINDLLEEENVRLPPR
jgi:hypothetical protein